MSLNSWKTSLLSLKFTILIHYKWCSDQDTKYDRLSGEREHLGQEDVHWWSGKITGTEHDMKSEKKRPESLIED